MTQPTTFPQTPIHYADSLEVYLTNFHAALEHLRTQNPQTLLERSRVLLSPVFRPLTARQAQAVFSAWQVEKVN